MYRQKPGSFNPSLPHALTPSLLTPSQRNAHVTLTLLPNQGFLHVRPHIFTYTSALATASHSLTHSLTRSHALAHTLHTSHFTLHTVHTVHPPTHQPTHSLTHSHSHCTIPTHTLYSHSLRSYLPLALSYSPCRLRHSSSSLWS